VAYTHQEAFGRRQLSRRHLQSKVPSHQGTSTELVTAHADMQLQHAGVEANSGCCTVHLPQEGDLKRKFTSLEAAAAARAHSSAGSCTQAR